MNSGHLQTLQICEVYPDPEQPRKIFAQKELEELAQSIEQNGLIQPIKVRPDGSGRFIIICGERRYRAHGLLGRSEISALVVDMPVDKVRDAAIVENLQRKDITPMEEARAYQKRLDEGLSVEELARRLGIKQPWRITERTALLKLDATYQDAFEKGLLTPSQAFEMSKLGKAYQRLLFEAIQNGKCKSYAELRAVTGALIEAERRAGGAEPKAFRLGASNDVQASLFSMPEPSAEERQVVRRMEQKIAAVEDLLRGGIKDNEVVIAHKVSPANAALMAQKLELIEKQLAKLRLALRAAAVTEAA